MELKWTADLAVGIGKIDTQQKRTKKHTEFLWLLLILWLKR
jgi:hypothetical protein